MPNRSGVGRAAGQREIPVDQAWAITTGSRDIVLAVVDTGVNGVPDLAGRVLQCLARLGLSARTSATRRSGDEGPSVSWS